VAAQFAAPSAPAMAGTPAAGVTPPAASGRWWALAVVVAAQFMFVVDAFIVNVAIPSIRADLHATPAEIEAVIAAYQITYATTVITGGRLGDIAGRRRVFVGGVLAFTAASLWCGLAGSGLELVLARMAQGVTAAMMVPQVLATIHTLFPGTGRPRAFAVFGVALGLGGAVGFALGGWLVTLDLFGLGWRSVFLVNLPLGAAIALAALRVMPEAARRPGIRLDLPGAAALFLSLACLIGPVMAGHELGWPWWLWAAESCWRCSCAWSGRWSAVAGCRSSTSRCWATACSCAASGRRSASSSATSPSTSSSRYSPRASWASHPCERGSR